MTNKQLNAGRVHKPRSNNNPKQFEVWARDQYNQNAILAETHTVEEAVAEAKRYVHEKNRNNPLTFDEQKKNWDHYLIFISDDDGNPIEDDCFYAGNLVHGKHKVLIKDDNDKVVEHNLDLKNEPLRFYLGEMPVGGAWYYQDARRRIVDRVDHPDVVGKTALFVQKVRTKHAIAQ